MKRIIAVVGLVAVLLPITAFALGLGEARVLSKLNEPLRAEIELLYDTEEELENAQAMLAGPEDFSRIGLRRDTLGVDLEFAIIDGERGPTLLVTSREPVRDPFLNFLLEMEWTNGRLLREYVLLLDPPVTVPAIATTRSQPPTTTPIQAEPEPLPAESFIPEPRDLAEEEPVRASVGEPASSTEYVPPADYAAGDYGPVAAGETLWSIAQQSRPAGVSINEMMVAIYQRNPEAFYRDNINALKSGAILRMPDNTDLEQSMLAGADSLVADQNAAWGDVVAQSAAVSTSVPAVAETSSFDTSASFDSSFATEPEDSGRLELLSAGDDPEGIASGDFGSTTSAAVGDSSELQRELAQTRETLASEEQENAELRSRLSDLEALLENYERLISIKDSEIATLQAASGAQVETDSAFDEPAPGESVDPFADDFGFDESSSDFDDAASNFDSSTATDELTEPFGETSGFADESFNSGEDPLADRGFDSFDPAEQAMDDDIGSELSQFGPVEGTDDPFADEEIASTDDPFAQDFDDVDAASGFETDSAFETGPGAGDDTAEAETVTQPASAVQPAQQSSGSTFLGIPILWLAGGGALIALLLVMMLLRRRRGAKTEIEDAPIPASFDRRGGEEAARERLEDAVANEPSNSSAHLALLRHYHKHDDSESFFAAAEAMHEEVHTANNPDWDEVVQMGRAIAPDHPLFADSRPSQEAEDDFALDFSDLEEPAPSASEPETPARGTPSADITAERQAAVEDELSLDFDNEPVEMPDGEQSERDSLAADDFDSFDAPVQEIADEEPQRFGSSGEDDSAFQLDDLPETPDQDLSLDLEPAGASGDEDLSLDLETQSPPAQEDDDLSLDLDEVSGVERSAGPAFEAETPAIDEPVAEAEVSRARAELEAEARQLEETDRALAQGAEDELDDSLELDDDALFEGEDATSTKLDLARAYIEMGDPDGARDMLSEVLDEGSADQRDEARRMISELGD